MDKNGDGRLNRGELMASVHGPHVAAELHALEAALPRWRQCELPSMRVRPTVKPGQLVLFVHPICPFAARAWWLAAELLDLARGESNWDRLRAVEIDILSRGDKPVWFARDVWQAASTPALQYGPDITVGDSVAVVRWLDENRDLIGVRTGKGIFGNYLSLQESSTFFPTDPDDLRVYEEMMESFMIKVAFPMYGICFNQDLAKDSALAQQIRAGVGWFNGILASRPVGPFFLGRLLSMFEIMTAPFFNIFRHTLLHWRGLDIMQPYEGEPLGAWMRAVDATPSFQFIQRDAEYYNRAYVIACELPRVVNETAPVDLDAAAGAGSAPVCVR